ncbi:MAG: ATP-grasp domain-containing protein [Candidatus Sifarchaeia archaeon]|jgi:ribosomal protein S6--L-glutamate ligase
MVKQIGVLSKNKEYFPTSQLLAEIKTRKNISGVHLSTQYVFPVISTTIVDSRFANQSLIPLLGIIPRIGRTQTTLGLICLKQFELMEIPSTLTAEALYLSRDKFRCFQTLSSLPSIQLPKTILINNTYQIDRLLKAFQFPLVIKIPDSTQGSGIVLAQNTKTALEVIESLFIRDSKPIMLQEYLHNDKSSGEETPRDIRVFVVGEEIIGGMKRIAPQGEWRTNFAQGATCKKYILTSEEEELVHQIRQKIGIEVAGIDLFPTPEGMYLLEVNACPGWKAFQQTHPKIKVAKKIVDYLITKIKQ